MNNSRRVTLLPPWSAYINRIKELFKEDPQIIINTNFNSEHPSVSLATNNPDKASALLKLLPLEKEFGGVTLKINVDCYKFSNKAFTSVKELFKTVFYKNPVLEYVKEVNDQYSPPFSYVIFKNEVVQFYDDNLSDPDGYTSTLYQDIASEVFNDLNGVAYCTSHHDFSF
jgi:hypothetical protein